MDYELHKSIRTLYSVDAARNGNEESSRSHGIYSRTSRKVSLLFFLGESRPTKKWKGRPASNDKVVESQNQ